MSIDQNKLTKPHFGAKAGNTELLSTDDDELTCLLWSWKNCCCLSSDAGFLTTPGWKCIK